MIHGFKTLIFTTVTVQSMALAQAATIVKCETEDTFIEGWKSPITLTYTGGDTGEISVESDHVNFSVPAHLTKDQTDLQGTKVERITMLGTAQTTSNMPEPAALNACIAGELKPEEQADTDAQANAFLKCAGKVPSVQVPVTAHAMIMLLPINDPEKLEPIVQTSRRYLGVKFPWGGDILLETMPGGDCKLIE
ncbi:hypothetical protein AB4Z43_28680 [Mesorhizobium sp. 2RAF45]|uniref:hypothetical protein n=1 Tax=Mesorhizobium sp. 2RAF45 TaxID=3233001 RepID=UPI003F99EBC3